VPGRCGEALQDESIIRFVWVKVSLSNQDNGLVSCLQYTYISVVSKTNLVPSRCSDLCPCVNCRQLVKGFPADDTRGSFCVNESRLWVIKATDSRLNADLD
jgi:hypothetical protein